MRITAAALLITATLNTSRGCTRIVSIVPMVTSWCPLTRRRVFNSNTTRHSHSGLKYGFVATCNRQYSAAWSGVSQTRMDSGNGHSRNATTLYSLAVGGAPFNVSALAGVTSEYANGDHRPSAVGERRTGVASIYAGRSSDCSFATLIDWLCPSWFSNGCVDRTSKNLPGFG